MAPLLKEKESEDIYKLKNPPEKEPFRKKYRVGNIIKLTIVHGLSLYTVVFKLHQMRIWTIIFTIMLIWLAMLGTTAGAHRLWAHRSYKATWPLKLFLFYCYTISSQISLHKWILTHRLHHKFSDTEADPHNSKRGFFFSHIGWVMMYKTPECSKEEKKIDMSDILEEPLARFQTRFFLSYSYFLSFLHALVPVIFWKEDPILSLLATLFLRFTCVLHATVSINSFAHLFGSKPYNKRIQPTDGGLLSFFTFGEAWHNYHHTFPWDYKAGEFGDKFNLTARFLDLCGKLGLAYDFKTAPPQMIANMKEKYGDGSESH